MMNSYSPFTRSADFTDANMSPQPYPNPRTRAAQTTDDLPSKKHAACDECRKRKLKCSGEPTGCTRCLKNSLDCLYSVQKQMGRPKKRQKTNDSADRSGQPPTNLDPALTATEIERTQFQNICNGPMSQTIRRSAQSQSTLNTPPSDYPPTPPSPNPGLSSYPTDFYSWPDFSDTNLPMPLIESYEKSQSPLLPPASLTTLPATPDCPCLPNLYLTLSTLSTLTSFPITSSTITTLSSAHSTARNVIYCNICPRKFQTGSQNVMLSSTLITVLVDQWKRISKATADTIRSGFCPNPPPAGPPSEMSPREDLEWRTFSYDLMRHFVFGDRQLPALPYQNGPKQYSYLITPSSRDHVTLTGLAETLERRQRVWHNLQDDTGEFAPKMTAGMEEGHMGFTLEDIKEMEKEHGGGGSQGHLCIQLVKHAKRCIGSLDREVPRLG